MMHAQILPVAFFIARFLKFNKNRSVIILHICKNKFHEIHLRLTRNFNPKIKRLISQ